MIRINLLAVERDRAKRRAGIAVSQKVAIGSVSVFVVAVGLVGWQFWGLRQSSQRLDEELAAARQEITRLSSVLEQVKEFDARRAQLAQRVTLIEQLRQGQAGPVRLLDQVSASIPDGLWLTELRQEGAAVVVQGRSTTLTSLSDFVANLESSGHFLPPVEIVDSQLEAQPQGEVVRFELRGQFQLPGS
jgi:type IV pilus assembly protein PilN